MAFKQNYISCSFFRVKTFEEPSKVYCIVWIRQKKVIQRIQVIKSCIFPIKLSSFKCTRTAKLWSEFLPRLHRNTWACPVLYERFSSHPEHHYQSMKKRLSLPWRIPSETHPKHGIISARPARSVYSKSTGTENNFVLEKGPKFWRYNYCYFS